VNRDFPLLIAGLVNGIKQRKQRGALKPGVGMVLTLRMVDFLSSFGIFRYNVSWTKANQPITPYLYIEKLTEVL
jgi:hypothetical protein